MNLDHLYQEIDNLNPKLVFLSGKTSTGKTSLSNRLQKKYDCEIIELDEIVYGLDCPAGKNRFIEAYQMRNNEEFTNSFVNAVRKEIGSKLSNHRFVIFEGAIVNVETLQEIIKDCEDSFLFIYMEIKNIEVYIQRLVDRFIHSTQEDDNGLPSLFWEKFTPDILKNYYETRIMSPSVKKAIEDYANSSMLESSVRLANFSTQFKNIVKVEV